MKRILVGFMLLGLLGCTTTKPVDPNVALGKSLLATKDTIINVHESFRVPCKTGVVPADVCKHVDTLTTESKPIYDAAVDAAVLGLQTGNTSDAKAKQETLEKLAGDMIALSIKYSVKGVK